MRSFEELRTTTSNYVYRRRYFRRFCCLKCLIRGRRKYYHIFKGFRKQKANFPNWKLVSKNRKQWMKKPLKFEKQHRGYTEIKW